MGKGHCGNKEDFKSDGGKTGGNVSLFATIMEAIGTIVNFGPACCICCILGCCGEGCCLCFFTLVSGIANLVGASVPTCCQKTSAALCNFTITSGVSLILRIIVAIVLIMEIVKWNEKLEDFEDCYDKYKGTYNAKHYCSNKYIHGFTPKSVRYLVRMITTCLVLACIWLLVSLVGFVFGYKGKVAEEAAEKEMGAPQAAQAVPVEVQPTK
mmetsp:Transcript_52249/g.67003  ORF Transcript_52249/g.67003 Transcript_52249/m.67003 type:complete len:211 (-) Transcript_52249:167-799(-)